MLRQWLLLVIMLVASGTVSGSETALFGLSRVDLRGFAASGGHLKRRAHQLMQRPRRVLMTILIANTAINVLFFAMAFVIFEQIGRDHPLVASVGGVGALLALVIGGEILPKALARTHAATLAPIAAPFIYALQTVLTPVRLVLGLLVVEPLTRLFQPHADGNDEMTVEELRTLVEMSAHRGVIDSAENRMLQEVVALPQLSVRSILTPRVDVAAIAISAPPREALELMRQASVPTAAVYGEGLDDVRGIVRARDLHLGDEEPLDRLVRTVSFVPEQINVLQLLEHFRASKSELAVVVDEYGGMTGLVTLQDVIDQIVGSATTSERPDVPATEVLDENTYRLAGNLSVHDWAQRFGLAAPGSPWYRRVRTLAGLVAASLGHWPRIGDRVRIRNLTLTVESMEGRRVDRILLRRERRGPSESTTAAQRPEAHR